VDFTPILRSFLRFSPRCDGMLEKMLIGMVKWSEGASPVRRFTVVGLLILFMAGFMIWYWDWANLSSEGMVSAFILNIFVFFFILMPLTWLWKKMKS